MEKQEMEKQPKLCPVMSKVITNPTWGDNQFDIHHIYCYEAVCAWWNPNTMQCGKRD